MKKSEIIIYIHGFGSCGLGNKANLFKTYFSSNFITPSLSYVPKLAITSLEEIISLYKNVYLIGSSLGGYYATYLSQKKKLI